MGKNDISPDDQVEILPIEVDQSEELIKVGDWVEIWWNYPEKPKSIKMGKILQMPRGAGDLLQIDFADFGVMVINPHNWAFECMRKLGKMPSFVFARK